MRVLFGVGMEEDGHRVDGIFERRLLLFRFSLYKIPVSAIP